MFGGISVGIAWWMVCGEWREENTLWLSLCLLPAILHKIKIKVGLSLCPSKNESLSKIFVFMKPDDFKERDVNSRSLSHRQLF